MPATYGAGGAVAVGEADGVRVAGTVAVPAGCVGCVPEGAVAMEVAAGAVPPGAGAVPVAPGVAPGVAVGVAAGLAPGLAPGERPGVTGAVPDGTRNSKHD